MPKRLVLVAGLLVSLVAPGGALACPVCLGAAKAEPSVAERIANSAAVVLARPATGPRRFAVVAVLKGRNAAPAEISVGVTDMPAGGFGSGGLVALGQHPLLATWTPIAEVTADQADWLKRLAGLRRASELDADGWRLRVTQFSAELFDADALVSRTASQEIAAAPYGAIRSLAGRIDVARITQAIADPENAPRAPLYLLLLGVSGDRDAKAYIAERSRAIGGARDEDKAALFTAWLESDPGNALAFARSALCDRSASNSLVAAMYAGLRVHGDAGPLRGQIVELYGEIIARTPERVGYMANDLEFWRDWSLAPQIAAAAESPLVEDSARLLARAYVRAAYDATRLAAQKD